MNVFQAIALISVPGLAAWLIIVIVVDHIAGLL